jgi:FO synthase
MAHAPDASRDELLWSIAVARLIFGTTMSIQTPPNLARDLIGDVIDAGINDWGGISPITADFVNPEAPWPHIVELSNAMQNRGRELVQRLPLYPAYAADLERWADRRLHSAILELCDSNLLARDSSWAPGQRTPPIWVASRQSVLPAGFQHLLAKCDKGQELTEDEIMALFGAREKAFDEVCKAADAVRSRMSGNTIRYVVNRNINYTNVCSYHCSFCAFSKNKRSQHDPVKAYDLDPSEIGRRVREAWDRGATEVCMQGGIHPNYTGDTYLAILRAAKDAVPDMHVHAFSPLEIHQGASTLGLPLADYLSRLRDAGLGTLPGTAAEILDDDVRRIICPDKLTTQEWVHVIETAHRVGLRTTATIMFGHVDRPRHWARHLLVIRHLQERTGGFTEFVPLPFVHMEAPMFFKGRSRPGPTWRETVLMHAVARLVLNPVLTNVQVSWVKLGVEGAKACLRAGANDLGGTLMNESISRAAGSEHGQEMPPPMMDQIILSLGRDPEQRTTLYTPGSDSQRRASYHPGALTPIVLTPARKLANVTRSAVAPSIALAR